MSRSKRDFGKAGDMETENEPERAALKDAPFARISKNNLGELAYGEIRSALIRGHIKPGEALILRPLSAKLGISPTPVREALLRLASEQALELDERGRALVPSFDRNRFIEIRDLRIELEGRGVARAAEIASQEEIDRQENIHARMVEAENRKDFSAALEYNEQFHLTLCQLARMPVLYRVVESLWLQSGPLLNFVYAEELPKWPRHPHVIILDGLKRRDSGMARAAIAEDIGCFGSVILRAFDAA